MAKIISFPDEVPFPVFKDAENGTRVLLRDGTYSEEVPAYELYPWLDANMGRISPRVIEAISKAEQAKVGR